MSAILDKLLKGQKVEWLPINEIVLPTKNIKWKDVDSIYQYIDLTSVDRKTNAIIETSLIDKENAPSRAQKIVEHNDIIFATTRPTQMRIAVITEELHEQIASTGYCILRADIKIVLPKWIYYNLSSVSFKNYLEENESGSAYPAISDTKLKEFKIPIPPLDVQAEIVRILDAFTAITAELTQELAKEKILREKQYQYYRDCLLIFENSTISEQRTANSEQRTAWQITVHSVKLNGEIRWKKLSELGQLIRGNGLQKSDFTEDGFPAIHYGQIYTFYGTFADKTKSFVSENLAKKLKKAHNGDVLLAGTSENIQDVMKPLGWLGNEIAISGDMFAFRPNTELDTKYLTYLLQTTEFQKYKEKYAHGTKVTRLNAEKFLRFEIAIPPLNEQKRIANILDKFETLAHSITQGLPKEITLRQRQYEYYREQLLDFVKN